MSDHLTSTTGSIVRPSTDDYFMAIATIVATRATCRRRKVGCVITDKLGRIMATGYNGVARGQTHCIDEPCAGADRPSGQYLDLCEAIHAEQNALLQCPDPDRIYKVYVTTAPCVTCVKLLLNTSCKEIVYLEDYSHNDEAKRIWTTPGRRAKYQSRFWSKLDMETEVAERVARLLQGFETWR